MNDSRFVIGKSLPHTLSPKIHRALGDKDYSVREFGDEAALKAFVSAREYSGLNVTIPYKETVIPLLDGIDETAARVGAVNTVVNRNGKLLGSNTDVGGMAYALKKAGIPLAGKNILILGSGGTAKTARYLAEVSGAKEVRIVSRTGELNYDNCYGLYPDAHVIVNATPVGMMPRAYETPIDLLRFKALEGVFDAIYNPLETLLIKTARAMGVPAANGLEMLIEQARLSHNAFQEVADAGGCAEEGKTERIAKGLRQSLTNIVLTGMAGSGKTVIGKKLAQKLNRPFVDTDEEVEKARGASVQQIFATEGEAAFRQAEKEATESVSRSFGQVIATGGGSVLSERNRFFLRSNGVIVLIVRDVDKLAIIGRPLSPDRESAKRLWLARKELYYSFADVIVETEDDPDKTAEEIAAKITLFLQ